MILECMDTFLIQGVNEASNQAKTQEYEMTLPRIKLPTRECENRISAHINAMGSELRGNRYICADIHRPQVSRWPILWPRLEIRIRVSIEIRI